MGREVRRVAKNWEHPKDSEGEYIPLYDRCDYDADIEAFREMARTKSILEALDQLGYPSVDKYMPDWSEAERTHLMMYENTSEGTPISPALETAEELAKWLAENSASALGGITATYEQWLATCRKGSAPSVVVSSAGAQPGVAAMEEIDE